MSQGIFKRLQGELNAREKSPGLTMGDILDLPDSLRNLVNWMMRQEQVTLSQVAAYVQQTEESAKGMLSTLLDKGFVRELEVQGKVQYRVRLAPKRKSDMPGNLWRALDDKVDRERPVDKDRE